MPRAPSMPQKWVFRYRLCWVFVYPHKAIRGLSFGLQGRGGGIGTLADNGPLRSGCASAAAAVSAFPSGIALKVAAAAAPVTAASPLAHRSPMGAFSVAFAIKIGREVARFLRLIAAGRDLTITSKNTKKLLKKTNF